MITITCWKERRNEVIMDSPITIPNVTVSLPTALRERAGNRRTVMANGRTVREIIAALDHDFPGLRFNLCYETGELRSYVNIFLNRENIRYLDGLDTPVRNGATIHILQSVAGG
jgi:molybdopterin synthase sulfur carrier subunit